MLTTPRVPSQVSPRLERPALDLAALRTLHRAVLVDLHALSGAVRRLARRRATEGVAGTRRQALALESYVGDTCDSLTHHLAVHGAVLRPALQGAVAGFSSEAVPFSPTELVLDDSLTSLRRVAHVLVSRPDDADAATQLAADLRRVEALLGRHFAFLDDVLLPTAQTLLSPAVQQRIGEALRSDPAVALFDWCRMLHHADDREREHLRSLAPLRALVGPGSVGDHHRRVRRLTLA